jgi:tetratricopeptide (TPR) repeat protein
MARLFRAHRLDKMSRLPAITRGLSGMAEGPGANLSTRANLARARTLVAASLLALAMAGCQATEPGAAPDATAVTTEPAPAPGVTAAAPESAPSPTVQEPAEVKYYPSDEPLRLAVQHFKDGSYGLAERYFRDAVERAPKDLSAWIGLAASYDRLGRFDLADRAYRSAAKLGGETTDILNNEGYSYMLRGDLLKARAKFQAALRRDPGNPTIVNNLHLLDSSARYIERPPG